MTIHVYSSISYSYLILAQASQLRVTMLGLGLIRFCVTLPVVKRCIMCAFLKPSADTLKYSFFMKENDVQCAFLSNNYCRVCFNSLKHLFQDHRDKYDSLIS